MSTPLRKPLIALIAVAALVAPAFAILDDARSFAIEAALPWLEGKDGAAAPFAVRDAWWSGDSKVKEPKIIRHQMFKRNEYWFWAATDDLEGTISIAVYDDEGKLVKSVERFNRSHTAGVKVVPETTGTYYIRVVVESATTPIAHWAVVYGYR